MGRPEKGLLRGVMPRKGKGSGHGESRKRKRADEQPPPPAATGRAAAAAAGAAISQQATDGGGAAAGGIEVSEGEQRIAIKAMYNALGALPPEQWGGSDGVVRSIMAGLNISNPRTVEDVLHRLYNDPGVDVSKRRKGGGAKPKIKLGTAACDTLLGALKCNFGQKWTRNFVAEEGVECHRTTVGRTFKRLEGEVTKRGTQKTGSRDTASQWAKVRKAFVEQLKRQRDAAAKEKPDKRQRPLHLTGCLFADEHMEECVIGGAGHHGQAGRYEYRTPEDENGVYCPKSKGGKMPAPRPETKPKHAATASGVFACAAPLMKQKGKGKGKGKKPRSVRVGKMAEPLSYTGRHVLGVKSFKKEQKKEIARVRTMKGQWTKFNGENPYKERYGKEWEAQLLKTSKMKKFMCITEIMDWCIKVGEEMFKGSTREKDWMIFHDRLPQWFEPRPSPAM